MEMDRLEKLFHSALATKSQKIQMLMDENKQFCEALDGVEQLWKKYEDDLREKDCQIKEMEKYTNEQSEIIFKLRNEIKEKDLVLDNQRKELVLNNKERQIKDSATEHYLKVTKDKVSEMIKIKW